MASELAQNGGKKGGLLSAIRKKLEDDKNAELRPAEAVLLLQWAIDCEDLTQKADLLGLFDRMGGMRLMREAFPDAR